jgi:hypothetical protein
MAKLVSLRRRYHRRAEALAEELRQELIRIVCKRWPITGNLRNTIEQLHYDQLLQFYNELNQPPRDEA